MGRYSCGIRVCSSWCKSDCAPRLSRAFLALVQWYGWTQSRLWPQQGDLGLEKEEAKKDEKNWHAEERGCSSTIKGRFTRITLEFKTRISKYLTFIQWKPFRKMATSHKSECKEHATRAEAILDARPESSTTNSRSCIISFLAST
jgi:hypothetical protein